MSPTQTLVTEFDGYAYYDDLGGGEWWSMDLAKGGTVSHGAIAVTPCAARPGWGGFEDGPRGHWKVTVEFTPEDK